MLFISNSSGCVPSCAVWLPREIEGKEKEIKLKSRVSNFYLFDSILNLIITVRERKRKRKLLSLSSSAADGIFERIVWLDLIYILFFNFFVGFSCTMH
jgi:uncharacterized membrane protein